MIQFQHIEYLFGLLAVPLMLLLFVFVVRWKKATSKKIGDPVLVDQLISNYSSVKFQLKFILFTSAFIIAVIALANPRKPIGSAVVNSTGIDVMIALDVSKSMLAKDISPNRLERAKQFLSKLIDKLPDDRIGMVVFAGRAYLQMPLTTDHAAAKMYLATATPAVVPTQGTVITDALKMCNASFNHLEKKYKSIILISDGEDHGEDAVTLAKNLANEGVTINTIGIGSPEGSLLVDSETNEVKKDATGAAVISKLNELGLKEIATNGNGVYQLFTNTDDVLQVLDKQLKTMGQKTIKDNSLINYTSFFQWLLALSLLLLLGEFLMSEVKLPSKSTSHLAKKLVNPLVIFLFFILYSCSTFAQNDNEIIKKGNDAYNKKEYQIASEEYKKAAQKNPSNKNAQYNLGNALYKNEKPEEALTAYDEAIKNSPLPTDKSGAFFNKGVVLQNTKKLPESITAYKNALRLNPTDDDARANLQKALIKQKEQEEKENNNRKKPTDDPKKKDQPKKPDEKKDNNLPKPQQSKMTKKEAEEKLKALLQQEKKLQDKLRKVGAASPDKPEKDW